jgi:two-component system, OmpR family, sensor histidine kinase MtrB
VTAVALLGWLLASGAAARALVLRRRLELVADAEHELRGPLAALALAAEAARRRSGQVAAGALEGQLERAGAGLDALAAARCGRRARMRAARQELGGLVERAAEAWRAAGADVRLDWPAGDTAALVDPGRLSQALGNLLANAVEHGDGPLTLRGTSTGGRVRIELRNRDRIADRAASRAGRSLGRAASRAGRGRGLPIAQRAVREAGGALTFASDDDGTAVAIEFPLAEP